MTTRRDFLALSATATLLGASPSRAQDGSALVTGKPKGLKYDELKGFLSKDQLTPHHQAHYGGALKSLLGIETDLDGADRAKANPNYSAIRELKREQVHALNSVLLHELYFDGLSGQGGDPGEAAKEALQRRFGSLEKWLEDFKAAAIAARGWAVLSLLPANGKLYNVTTDVHDVGPIVSGIPLVVIDCYEHAYYVDYRNKKGDYVAAYPKFIDWQEIERRVKSLR